MIDSWEGGQGWSQPDEWPPHTNWSTQPTRRPGRAEKRAARQTAMIERERTRTSSSSLPHRWRHGRCGHCDARALQVVKDWRDRYITWRCAQCLWWRQRPAPGTLYEADDWPYIGDWTDERFHGRRTASKQAEVVERERARTPVLASTVPWFRRRKCRSRRGGCGRKGMVVIRYWRPRYTTRRCIFCLRWSHTFNSGGG